MNEISRILVDCEELINQELELETKLSNKSSLIEEQKNLLQITSNDEEKKVAELENQLFEEKEKIKEHAKINQKQEAQFQAQKDESLQLQINQLKT